jgi:hypothetical protein
MADAEAGGQRVSPSLRIEYAIPCRYAEAAGNLGTIVGAGIDTWHVAELPARVGLMVAVRAVGPPNEVAAETHSLHCHIEAPDGSRVGDELDSEIQVEAPNVNQDWLLGAFIPVGAQWEAEVEGTYTIHVAVDGSDFPLPMHVVQAPSE